MRKTRFPVSCFFIVVFLLAAWNVGDSIRIIPKETRPTIDHPTNTIVTSPRWNNETPPLLLMKNATASPTTNISSSSSNHPLSPNDETPNVNNSQGFSSPSSSSRPLKFFILALPQVTTELITGNNHEERASRYYEDALNEESAEIWLHRGFDRMTLDEGHTLDPSEADVFLISGYLHLNLAIINNKKNHHHSFVQHYRKMIVDPSKPHLLLIPSWNPTVSQKVGIKVLAKALMEELKENTLWSVGFERNQMWQVVDVDRILPIPYVVRPSESRKELTELARNERTNNFVFYAGAWRKHAKNWAGCHRDLMIPPLMRANQTIEEEDTMDVRLVGKHARLGQTEYNNRMASSEYCLIVCGDTVSSRSLTSAMVSGCIPIRVGSRLRGLCEPPCKKGWGWAVTGTENPHLPFPDQIPWEDFPEVDEANFTESGRQVLQDLFLKFDEEKKNKIRSVIRRVQNGWIYGWGDPVNSTDFGEAVPYIWNSFKRALQQQKDKQND